MKTRLEACFGLLALTTFCLWPANGRAESAPEAATPPASATAHFPPNVDEVVKLAKAGTSDDVLLAFVKNSPTPFNLGANDILALKDAGISTPVMTAMLNHDAALRDQAAQTLPLPPPVTTSNQKLYTPTQTPEAAAVPPPITAPAATIAPAPTVPPAPVAPAAPVAGQAPPAAQVEVVPVSPGPSYYWVPGYWSWRGGVWVWVGGSWVLRPYPGAVWVGGHWGRHGRGVVWIGAGWR
ncbi:conserved exported hypothetical protein [Verrucomicrobia bacterium]|nr:conserved exported hypothetical protein [Verrucomicrobiota bacterium]